MAAVRVKAPAKSMDAFSFLTRVSTRYRVTPARERNPSGTLMKKIQRQEKYATMKPPIVGPSTLARPQTKLPRESVFPRSPGGEMSVSTM